MSNDEYDEVVKELNEAPIKPNKELVQKLKDHDKQVIEYYKDEGFCRERFCHETQWEFGYCKKHFYFYEQLYKEYFVRTKILYGTIEEAPPPVYVSSQVPTYAPNKKSFVRWKKPRREPILPRPTLIETIHPEQQTRLDALKAKLKARQNAQTV